MLVLIKTRFSSWVIWDKGGFSNSWDRSVILRRLLKDVHHRLSVVKLCHEKKIHLLDKFPIRISLGIVIYSITYKKNPNIFVICWKKIKAVFIDRVRKYNYSWFKLLNSKFRQLYIARNIAIIYMITTVLFSLYNMI